MSLAEIFYAKHPGRVRPPPRPLFFESLERRLLLSTSPILSGAAPALYPSLTPTLVGPVAPGSPSPASPGMAPAGGGPTLNSSSMMSLSRLVFEPNVGQTDASVGFVSTGTGYALALRAHDAVLRLDGGTPGSQAAVQMQWVGGNATAPISGADPLPGVSNYLLGNDPSAWHTNVPNFGAVRYQGIYAGTDLVFHGGGGQLEYDWNVAAGADPGRITMKFEGTEGLSVDAQGRLLLHTAAGDVVQEAPVVYQEVDGQRHDIAGSYVLTGDDQVGFTVGAYDRSLSLVIDPVLVYSTYLGGNGQDVGHGIGVEPDGTAYVTGTTDSTNFAVGSVLQSASGGATDAFVTKLDPSGHIVFSTYLGGSPTASSVAGQDFFSNGAAIAVDRDGNAYVTGDTVQNGFVLPATFPLVNPAQSTPQNGDNAFVAKLDPTGSRLLYSTYLSGLPSRDGNLRPEAFGSGIAVDAQGNAYVTGTVFRSGLAGETPDLDAFVAKFDAGGALAYAKAFGGFGNDEGNAIAMDPKGNAYVGGTTNSPDFATQSPVPNPHLGGDTDAFIAKFDPTGSPIYAIRLGGSTSRPGGLIGHDEIDAIAVDDAGEAYVTGVTTSTDFPTVNAIQGTNLSRNDGTKAITPPQGIGENPFPFNGTGFVTKVNADGSALVFSTYLGGSGSDAGSGIALDSAGNVYVTGVTTSPDFPVVNPENSTISGAQDAFLTKLSSDGSTIMYSTFLGGSGLDGGSAIAVDAAGSAYVTGWTTSAADFPTRNAAQPLFGGGNSVPGGGGVPAEVPVDAFVAKVTERSTVLGAPSRAEEGTPFHGTVATFTDPRLDAKPGDFAATIDWGDGPAGQPDLEAGTVSLDPAPTAAGPLFDVSGEHTYGKPGAYPILVTVHDTTGNPDPATNVDVSRRIGNQAEGAIAVDPNDPMHLFTASVDGLGVAEATSVTGGGLFAAFSTDGGATWTPEFIATGADGLRPAFGDPRVAFDQFGNLFLTYLDASATTAPNEEGNFDIGGAIVVAVSKDVGKTFTQLATFQDPRGVDQPALTTGPGPGGVGGSVWVSFEKNTDDTIAVTGAPVFGTGAVGTFTAPAPVPGAPNGGSQDFMGLAVGLDGQPLISYRQPAFVSGPSAIFVNRENQVTLAGNSFGPLAFGQAIKVTSTNLGAGVGLEQIPADPRGVGGEADLAGDHSSDPHRGRIYLVYTDAPTMGDPANHQADPNTNIFLRYSDDNGATWSAPVRVNNDTGVASQFFPSLAVDPLGGEVAVGWYDTRNSPTNVGTQFFTAVSDDGGQTFSSNLQVSQGLSTVPPSGFGKDFVYGDYSGLAFVNGRVYPVWADNSPTLLDAVDLPAFELATAVIGVIDVGVPAVAITPLSIMATEGASFTGRTIATFTHPDASLAPSNFSAVINWGDGTPTTAGTITQPGGQGGTPFAVTGTHAYAEQGAFPVTVTVHDIVHDTDAVAVSNISERQGYQGEGTIAIDPTNPSDVLAAANDEEGAHAAQAGTGGGLFVAVSSDGGVTWMPRIVGDGSNGLPLAFTDPKAAFDQLGNLFLTYIDAQGDVVLLNSTDDGQTFGLLHTFTPAPGGQGTDQPSVATGPGLAGAGGSVWVTYVDATAQGFEIEAAGAPVTGRGTIGAFSPEVVAPRDSSGLTFNFGDIAVGPTGQVLVTYQNPAVASLEPATIFTSLDPGGLGPGGFSTPLAATMTNVVRASIPPQAIRTVDSEPNLAWDRSTGPHRGRVYLSYTDAPTVGSADTNIFLRYSDDNGATWSAPVQVNDEKGVSSQFLPSLAVDQSTGTLAIGWYTASGDPAYVKSRFVLATSNDGGVTFSSSVQASAGASEATDPQLDHAGQVNQFGDYTGIAFVNGIAEPVWTDNSPELPGVPDRPQFELANARIGVAQVNDAPLTAAGIDVDSDEGEAFTEQVATFTDADPNAQASDYTATIDWGDGSKPSTGTIEANGRGGFAVTGTHAYTEEGSFDFTVTIRDATTSSTAKGSDDVNDNTLTATSVEPRAVEGVPFTGAVASFTDGDLQGAVPDYTATINWGDGVVTQGRVAFSGSASLVSGVDANGPFLLAIGNFFDAKNPANPDNGTPQLFDAESLPSGQLGPFLPVLSPTTSQRETLGSGFSGGLAFVSDQEIFAVRNDAGVSSLYRIDRLDDTVTRVFDLGSGFTGGLALNSTDSRLYAISQDGAGASTLDHLDTTDDTVTPLFALGNATFSGLTFNAADQRFYAIGNDADGLSTLYRISQGGAVSALFPLGFGFTGGLAVDPAHPLDTFYAIQATGDGSATLYQISLDGPVTPVSEVGANFTDGFNVIGGPRTFADEATLPLTVGIKDAGGSTVTGLSSLTVGDAPLAVASQSVLSGFQGVATGSVPLATFIVQGQVETGAGEYSASVNWGDGSPVSAGALTMAGTTIAVTGGHAFAAGGVLHPIVTLTDDASGSAAATLTATIAPDVTAKVRAVASGLILNPATDLFNGSLTLTNTTNATIPGPLFVALTGLPAGVTLVNATGQDAAGDPLITDNVPRILAGQTLASMPIQFSDPTLAPIHYAARVYDGPGSSSADSAAQLLDTSTLAFEANVGQTASQVQFLAHGAGYELFLTSMGTVFELNGAGAPAAVQLQWLGANAGSTGAGLDPLPGVSNYLVGADPSTWHTGIATYGAVTYQSLYPGVDLTYHGTAGHLEYDWVVAPGADPHQIALQITGASGVSLDGQGDLVVMAGGRELVQQALVMYQEINGAEVPITGGYVLGAKGQVSLTVGSYDPTRPLIIDPVFVYSGSFGGSFDDEATGVAADSAGNAYVTGSTESANFPTLNPLQGSLTARSAFVTKLDPEGVPIYSTYLGSSFTDAFGHGLPEFASGIAVDAAGNAYVTGGTGPELGPSVAFVSKLDPTGSRLVYSKLLSGHSEESGAAIAVDAAGAAYVTGSTGFFAFVDKLDPTGSNLEYSQLLGGVPRPGDNRSSTGAGIAVDGTGDAYVAGTTTESDFPLVNALQSTFHLTGTSGEHAFVTKLNTDGSAIVYSTFLGGTGADQASAIAVDPAGNAYVVGQTSSTDFPVKNALQPSHGAVTPQVGNGTDAFVTELNASGSALVYSTYLGGSGDDRATGVAVDAAGNAFVSGVTDSSDFPIVHALQSVFGGGATVAGIPATDGFVAAVNAGGAGLSYSTYLGGTGADVLNAIALDRADNAYVVGATDSTDFPTVNSARMPFADVPAGGLRGLGADAVVAKIALTGSGTLTVANQAIVATEGSAFSGAVATFTDTDSDLAGDFTATIDWGDGHITAGTITGNGHGAFTVTGSHTYTDEGVYAVPVTVRDADGTTATATSTAAETDAAGFVHYHIGIDTSALAGTAGFLSVQFNPGAIPDAQAAQVSLTEISGGGAVLVPGPTIDGGASGALPGPVQIANASTLNRLTQGVTFGSALSFDVQIAGDAIAHAQGGLFGSTLAVQLLAADRRTPELTTDPSGAVLTVDVSPDAHTRFTAFAPSVGAPVPTAAAVNTAVVRDAALTATQTPITAFEGITFTGPVATLADANLLAQPSDLTSVIDWGDGTAPSPGTISMNGPGSFIVTGSHTYAAVGHESLKVSIADRGGSSATAAATSTKAGGLQAPLATALPGGGSPVAADLHGDGKVDLVVPGAGPNGETAVLLGKGDGTFGDPIYLAGPSGTFSTAAIVGDFDRDGTPDVAVANSDNTISVYPQKPDGTFGPAITTQPLDGVPVSLATGDFNHDGKLDLVVGQGAGPRGASNRVTVLLGNGDGTFQNGVDYTVGVGNNEVAVADLNGDGQPDLVVLSAFVAKEVTVLLGKGDGTFAQASTFSADGAGSLAIGDFHHDGKPDLALGTPNAVEILMGQGNGSFATPVSYAVTGASSLAVGDLTGDGHLDIVASAPDANPSGLNVLLGKGDGTFLPAVQYVGANRPEGVVLADFTGDGHLDVATNLFAGGVDVVMGNGDGTLVASQVIPITQNSTALVAGHVVAAGDLTGDGRSDLVTVVNNPTTLTGDVAVLLSNADGTFQPPVLYPVGTNPESVAIGALIPKGKPDLVVTTAGGPEQDVSVLLGRGDGSFGTAVSYKLSSPLSFLPADPQDLALADVNRDGNPDILIEQFSTVLLGKGDGTFQSPTFFQSFPPSDVNRLATGDFNGDGKVDVATLVLPSVASGPGTVRVALGEGNGQFLGVTEYAVGTKPDAIAVADVNGDGKPDIVTANQGNSNFGIPGSVSVLLGAGDGSFHPAVNYPTGLGDSAVFLSAVDLHGAGKPDLVVGGPRGAISILFNNGDGTFGSPRIYDTGLGVVTGVTVGDFDGNGTPDIAVSGVTSGNFANSITVILNAPPATGGAKVLDAPLTSSGVTINPRAGLAFSTTVASFTDANPAGAASDFTATIDWADGKTSAGVITADGRGGFTVAGTHTYGATGDFAPTVTIRDVDGATTTAHGTAHVGAVDPPLTASGANVTIAEGASTGPVTVASFTDSDPNGTASDFTATIDWGDGQHGAGFISANSTGGFSVTGTHTYIEEGAFALGVAITDLGGSTATASGTAKVGDAALTASGTNVPDAEGASTGPVTVASFTDANPNGTASEFTAMIDWGDGQHGAGVISANSTGGFSVTGTHSYVEEGAFAVGVTIADTGGSTATASGTAKVADAALTASGANVTSAEGASTGPVTVASFTDANPNGTASDFTATIDWGDGQHGAGVISANSTGGFSVTGAHSYVEEGAFAVGVAISDVGGSTAMASGTAKVADPAVVATGAFQLTANAGSNSGPQAVATFTDPGGPEPTSPAHYTASIQWGDSTAATLGVIAFDSTSGAFTVTGDHTYPQQGTFIVTASIDHEGVVSAAMSTATIGHAGKVTGGGQIGRGRNFGFVVQPDEEGGFRGHLEYHDRANDFELDSTSITFVSIQSDNVHAMFTGTARVNDVAGYTFTVTVEDNGEPGKGVDRFRIQFTGPTSYDSNAVAANGGLLTAGNIEVHTRGEEDEAHDVARGMAQPLRGAIGEHGDEGQVTLGGDLFKDDAVRKMVINWAGSFAGFRTAEEVRVRIP